MANSIVSNDMLQLTVVDIPAENQTGLSGPSTGDIQVIMDRSRFACCRFATSRTVNSSSSGWYTLFTFPDNVAPAYDLKFMLCDDQNGIQLEARVRANAKTLDVYAPRSNSIIWGSFNYII